MIKKWLVVPLALALAGCGGSLLENQKIDYKSAAKLPTLEVPPDLTQPKPDSHYQVPNVGRSGGVTLSTYKSERAGTTANTEGAILPKVPPSKVRMVRDGTERWLVVSETPAQLWPVLKQFWQENGFLIKTEDREAGVMATDWAENRAKIPQDFIRKALGKLFAGMYSTPERDMFRTRLERGVKPGTTDIFISHRGVAEVYTDSEDDSTVWQPRPPDPGLEAEFLRRLMVKLGASKKQAAVAMAAPPPPPRARLVKEADGTIVLQDDEAFDRAWRRVGLALDRVGFTVEDRNRSKGIYYVRYIDPEADAQSGKKSEGILSKLMFWKSSPNPKSAEQYRVHVKDNNTTSLVEVLDNKGRRDKSATAHKILSLLYGQLR